jgi:membrane protease YdiL (CAAX protease family)
LENATYKSSGWKNVLLIIIPYFLFVGFFQFLGYVAAGLDFSEPQAGKTSGQMFILSLFNFMGTAMLVAFFTRYIVKKEILSVGFHPPHIVSDTLLGIAAGLVIMFLAFLLLLLTDQINVTQLIISKKELLLMFGNFVLVAILEELLLRGYVLNNLMVSFNKYLALFLSSALFSFMHLANPNIDLLGTAGLFIAGIFLGISYVFTKSLWFPIALHFSWNFFQSLFGFNVSGIDTYSLTETTFYKATIWNGGDFGFEASVLSLLFQLIGIFLIYMRFKDRTPYHIRTEATTLYPTNASL